MTDPTTSRRYWQQRTSALVWQVNAAAWLQRMAPAAFFVTSPFAIAAYALRRVDLPLWAPGVGLSLALALTALACWWRSRASFFGPREARVWLETQLRLDAALTAAEERIARWPAIPAERSPILRWRLREPLGWCLAALALIAAALLVPTPRVTAANRLAGPPPSLLQTEAMLAALKELNVADPKTIEQLADRARELARRPSDEQYSHSALEAADALRNQTGTAAVELARALDAAAAALQSNQEADMAEAAGRLSAALSGMRDGALPANKDLLSKLPSNGSQLKNLTAEQRAQLAKQLSQAAKGVAGAAGANARMPAPAGKPTYSWPFPGAGAGGAGGNGGSAPLALSSKASDTGEGRAEALPASALKQMALGDKLGTTAGAHDVDPSRMLAPTAAGAVVAPGSGGDAAWVNRLTPAERATLKQFFK